MSCASTLTVSRPRLRVAENLNSSSSAFHISIVQGASSRHGSSPRASYFTVYAPGQIRRAPSIEQQVHRRGFRVPLVGFGSIAHWRSVVKRFARGVFLLIRSACRPSSACHPLAVLASAAKRSSHPFSFVCFSSGSIAYFQRAVKGFGHVFSTRMKTRGAPLLALTTAPPLHTFPRPKQAQKSQRV